MWTNPFYQTQALPAVRALIAAQSLATVVASDPLRAAHVPLLLDEAGDEPQLIGHVPRADPVSEAVAAGSPVLSIFHGARAYVSPAWYETAGLPTYNFVVAHLAGRAAPLPDAELRAHLVDLVGIEERRKAPDDVTWTINETADRQIDQLLPQILGFRIRIDTAQAKAKLGQNRTPGDCRGTIDHLAASPRAEHRSVAEQMGSALDRRQADPR